MRDTKYTAIPNSTKPSNSSTATPDPDKSKFQDCRTNIPTACLHAMPESDLERLPLTGDKPGPQAAPEAWIAAADAILPQTQCRQCGYAGCLPYAQAMVQENAPINRCPPGDRQGVERLASLLGRNVIELDPSCGTPRPWRAALIDESECIGCTLCIQACPVDAIVGAPKRMHTVIAEECTGCDLCLAPCPVDCIRMVEPQTPRPWTGADADLARARLHARRTRAELARADNALRLEAEALRKLADVRLALEGGAGAVAQLTGGPKSAAEKQAIIERALARVRARRAGEPAGKP